MTRIIVVIYETQIYESGRGFYVPDHVAESLGLWSSRDKTKPQKIDVVVRTAKDGQLVLADTLKMTSGTELYVTDDRLHDFGLKPKDSIIVEASTPRSNSN